MEMFNEMKGIVDIDTAVETEVVSDSQDDMFEE